MEYLTGYTVKPNQVTGTGEVLFTDGTEVDLSVNQVTCEAYGYTYDPDTRSCRAFRYNTNLNRNSRNINNKFNGPINVAEVGCNMVQINGTNNTAKGDNLNCFINGSNNEVANGVNNTTVLGRLGEATVTNSIVLGGNSAADDLGTRQSIRAICGVQTTNNSVTNSNLNNTADSYVVVPTDTAMYFHADVIAVRVGGSSASGAVGDYKSWVERGVVINKSGVLSIQRERDIIVSSGTTTGWNPTGIVSDTHFILSVKASNNMTVDWTANITFTQIKTGVAL
jgi:hypothetical protein